MFLGKAESGGCVISVICAGGPAEGVKLSGVVRTKTKNGVDSGETLEGCRRCKVPA